MVTLPVDHPLLPDRQEGVTSQNAVLLDINNRRKVNWLAYSWDQIFVADTSCKLCMYSGLQ